MLELVGRNAIILGAGVVWFAGLRVFMQSALSQARKLRWIAFLVLIGVDIGAVLPLSQVWGKFSMLAAILPVLGLADVLLLRSGRGVSFGFESAGSKSAPRSVWLRPRAFHLT